MEDKIIVQVNDEKQKENRESKDLGRATISQSNKIHYNCTECPTIIEILSLDNNNIQFKCSKHELNMKIKEYLIKMKKYNNKYINDKICKIHNKENFSYCFDCCKHLCKECIKTREHAYHYKLYLEEIIPDNNILNKIEEKIIDNRAEIKNLKEKKKNKENKLDRKLNNNINKIKRAKERGIKSNKNK